MIILNTEMLETRSESIFYLLLAQPYQRNICYEIKLSYYILKADLFLTKFCTIYHFIVAPNILFKLINLYLTNIKKVKYR